MHSRSFLLLLVTLATAALSACTTMKPPALHVIAVYQGSYDKPVDPPPTPKECMSRSDYASRMDRKEYEQKCQSPTRVGQTKSVQVLVTDTSQPIVLGLMAYEPTEWRLEVAPNVVLRRIIVGGYHRQAIVGLPEDAVVEVHSHDSSPCGRCVHKQPQFYAHDRLPAEMEEAAGLKASSFQSRYTGESFSVFQGMR